LASSRWNQDLGLVMTNFSLSSLNARYRNLSEIAHSEHAWRIVLVDDALGKQAYDALLNCWNAKFLGEAHFEDLRSNLRDAYVTIRSAVGSTEDIQIFCGHILAALEDAIARSNNFLSENERTLLSSAVEKFTAYSKASRYPLAETVERLLGEGVHKKSVVVYSPSFIGLSTPLAGDCPVYGSIPRLLANVNLQDRNHAILVLSPDTMRVPVEYLRRLFLGGDIVKATFVIPSWWKAGSEELLNAKLAFDLPTSGKLKFVTQGTASVGGEIGAGDTRATDWDLSVPARPIAKELERFSASGPVECHLLQLNDGLVMPVEKDATRVSVIRKSPTTGEFEFETLSPTQVASGNEVVFSFAQVSERSFIREQAQRLLGDAYESIQAVQDEWKASLHSRALALGWIQLEKALQAAKVDKAHRVRWWVTDPNFIRPQTESDLQNLLTYLELTGEYIAKASNATRRLRHAHDSAGRDARKALISAMTEEIWTQIQSGKASEIKLTDVGEASFIACKTVGLSDSTVMANVLQVRRILGGH
jgi:hypothetical protein